MSNDINSNSSSTNLFKLLHQFTSQLQYLTTEEDVFELLAKFLPEIIPHTYFILSQKEEGEDCFRVKKSIGFEKLINSLIKMVGFDPHGVKLPFSEMPEENVIMYENRKMVIFEDGLFDLGNRTFNRQLLHSAEKLLSVDKVGAMSLCVGKDYQGGVAFLFKKSLNVKDFLTEEVKQVVETFMYQCSIVIKQFRDEQKLKANHEALLKSNKELEQHINFKNKLFSVIAHDLKTPFNSLLGFSELLITDYSKLSEDEKERYIEYINSSSRSAFNLVNNLLHWSRIQFEKIRINKNRFGLYEFVIESIEPFMLNAYKKKIHVEIFIPNTLEVTADKSTMTIVVYNLFMNAVKYSHIKSSVFIYGRKLENCIEIGIRDTGVGMSEEMQKDLLKEDKLTTTVGTDNEKGTGLGLLICNDFITRNGGNLVVSSRENEGSTFQIKLPL